MITYLAEQMSEDEDAVPMFLLLGDPLLQAHREEQESLDDLDPTSAFLSPEDNALAEQ